MLGYIEYSCKQSFRSSAIHHWDTSPLQGYDNNIPVGHIAICHDNTTRYFCPCRIFWQRNTGKACWDCEINIISMAQCKTAVTPSLTHWSYCRLVLRHRYNTVRLSESMVSFPQYTIDTQEPAIGRGIDWFKCVQFMPIFTSFALLFENVTRPWPWCKWTRLL